MPKKGEKKRKLTALRSGKGVRPTKRWFVEMERKVAKEYPRYGSARIAQIVGGIWSRYTTTTKMKIVRKYQR